MSGPRSLAEFFQWPRDVLDTILRGEEQLLLPRATQNMQAHMMRGIAMHTRYSGMGMPELSSHILEHALIKHLSRSADGITPDWVGFTHHDAWDIKDSARQVLLGFAKGAVSEHIFGDQLGHMNTQHKRHISDLAAQLSHNKLPLYDRERAFQKTLQFMMMHENELFKDDPTAWCYKHRRQCSAFQGNVSTSGLRLLVVGVTCKDHSRMNKARFHCMGKSGLPLLVFLFERRRLREDFILIECTVDQQLDLMMELLGEMYDLSTFTWGPEDQGLWTSRPRRFTLLTLKPSSDGRFHLSCSFSVFEQLFRRRRADGSGHMFICASKELLETVARSRSQCSQSSKWEDILSPTKATRLQLYRRDFLVSNGYSSVEVSKLQPAELTGLVKAVLQQQGSDAIADLTQNPGYWRLTRHLPCMCSHSEPFSLKARREFMTEEILVSHGLPMIDEPPFEVPLSIDAWRELSEVDQRDLAGNTINCVVLTSILAFLVASIEPLPGAVFESSEVLTNTVSVLASSQSGGVDSSVPPPCKRMRAQF